MFGPYNPSKSILLSSKIIKIANKFPSESANVSRTFIVESFLMNIATPLALEEKELNVQVPPHSSRTTFSMDLQILVSQAITTSGFFFFK